MTSGHYPRNRHALPPKTKSGLKGVICCPWIVAKPWKAYIRKHGMYRTIGYFSTREEAARAYNREAMKIHGQNTYFNRLPC